MTCSSDRLAPLEPKIEVCIANFASRCDDNGAVVRHRHRYRYGQSKNPSNGCSMEQDAWRQIGKRANDRHLGALEWPVPAIVIDMSQEI